MKIVGLFFVVFAIVGINKLMGWGEGELIIGVVIGAGTYILNMIH